MPYTIELSDGDVTIYECDECDRKFVGVANPQDTGDGPLCMDCWREAGN